MSYSRALQLNLSVISWKIMLQLYHRSSTRVKKKKKQNRAETKSFRIVASTFETKNHNFRYILFVSTSARPVNTNDKENGEPDYVIVRSSKNKFSIPPSDSRPSCSNERVQRVAFFLKLPRNRFDSFEAEERVR